MKTCLNPLFQHTLFLLHPLFRGYLNPQVRIKKMVSNVNYHHPCSSRLASRIHGFIFNSLGPYLSSEYLLSFLSHLFIFLENALNLEIFLLMPSSPLKTLPKFLSFYQSQKEITHSPRQR